MGAGAAHRHGPAPAAPRGSRKTRRAFAIGTVLNLGFAIAEAGVGWFANSLALIADAGHNLSDVAGLALAWAAATLSRRRPTPRFTYGLRSSSILAALANGALLLLAAGALGWEAVRRLHAPQESTAALVIGVALAGVVINGVTAWLLHHGQQRDLNVRGAYLHMLADAAVSLGVVVGGVVMWTTGWRWVDPVLSLVVVVVIVAGTWELFAESLRLVLHAVPRGVDVPAVRRYLESLPGVAALHDLHVWGMSTTDTALSAHLVLPSGHPGDAFLADVASTLSSRFGIAHATLQIEVGDHHPCALAPDHVV